MKTLSLWIFEILLIIHTGAKTFPEKFTPVKMNGEVTLTCGAKTGEVVTWKFRGKILEDLPFYSISGNNQDLNVSPVEIPLLGEYSCWRGEEKLSSTYLLLEDVATGNTDYLNCRAKSYDCNFTCEWTRQTDRAVRLRLENDCREHKSCEWITKNKEGGFHFELSHSLPPYDEESTMLEVTAEAIVNLSILKTTKRFYLRDIIQPDSPQIVTCQETEKDLNVTIEPPTTWSTPHSFFHLEHQIEYVLKDDGQTRHSSSTLIPKMISKLRARSRDPLVFSHWSQWTPWKNVRIGKKLCKCKNPQKYCCPELPSGYFDRCERRRDRKRNKLIQTS